MPNPFYSPSDATRESAAHVAEAAKKINPLLAAGQRVFHVPIGLADAIQDGLTEIGWIVTKKPHTPTPPDAPEPDALATLVLTSSAAKS